MKIIGFAGKAHSGKDTAQFLLKMYFETNGMKTTKIGFADKIKDCAATWFGWDRQRLDTDVAYKESDLLDPNHPELGKDPACEMLGMNRRQFMQRMGTECFRQNLHSDFWIILKRLAIMRGEFYQTDIGFITDVRYLNEIGFCQDTGGVVIKIVRPEGSETTAHNTHTSETEFERFNDWDAIVENIIDPNLSMIENRLVLLTRLVQTLRQIPQMRGINMDHKIETHYGII